ncbi:MAG: glycoside hydrolase [Phycisphaerales bacterium]
MSFTAELQGSRLTMRFVSEGPGKITWPVIPAQQSLKAYILPMFEGVYAPIDDKVWMDHLVDYGPMDTTADLSMPFVGLDYGEQTVTYIFGNIFDNRVVFERDEQGVKASVTHGYRANWDRWEYTVVVELGDGSPITPAKKFRDYLVERGELATMAQKIEANPNAARLLGAAHAYLWDVGVFSHLDVTDWKGFCAKLIEEGDVGLDTPASTAENPAPLGRLIWFTFDDEAKKAARQIVENQWPGAYAQKVVAGAVSAYLENMIEHLANMNPREVAIKEFTDHFAGLVRPADEWGDGISTKMLDELHDTGIDRMMLCLGDLNTAQYKPQVAARADELGYLFGPYDSYHSIHPPEGDPGYDANNTWDTAQFPAELYATGGIVREDGTMSAGFKKLGYHLSPLAARPYVEARVDEYMSRIPFSAVFVDCDAFGEFFDDYAPGHTATKQEDMLARLDRLSWLSEAHGLVVGSEGGSGYAAPVIHFAHGMLTPVIGWGDTDLKDKASPYFLGAYWPPDGPAIYTKQAPLKPAYKPFYYDPRSRLPLYQTVFHDSVVATHHWGNASLKFADQVRTVALLEQLYNVPPLYHLNLSEWKKHQGHILKHYAFFSPLHRELALQPMTGFEWLTDDRLVQRTTFGDGTTITVNFGDQPTSVAGVDLSGQSAVAVRPGGEVLRYSPDAAAE